VAHHGSRALILLALAALVTVLFPPSARMSVGRYEAGQVATEDVIARIPFSVPKSAEELARDRVLAMESVPPTFDVLPAAGDTMAARLTASKTGNVAFGCRPSPPARVEVNKVLK